MTMETLQKQKEVVKHTFLKVSIHQVYPLYFILTFRNKWQYQEEQKNKRSCLNARNLNHSSLSARFWESVRVSFKNI